MKVYVVNIEASLTVRVGDGDSFVTRHRLSPGHRLAREVRSLLTDAETRANNRSEDIDVDLVERS